MNIVLTESLGIPDELLSAYVSPLRASGHRFAAYGRTTDLAALRDEIRDADAILLANMPLPGEALRACGHLQFVDIAFTGVDHVEGVRIAGKRIVHTHAKDGKNLIPVNAEQFYHGFAEGGLEWMQSQGVLIETPLGEGDVRWPEYLRALRDVGYDGYLTIEREVKNGAEDIRTAVRFLSEQIAKL